MTTPQTRVEMLGNIGPNWFASVMGTGIVATAGATLPVRVPGLQAFTQVVWVIAAVLLAVLIGANLGGVFGSSLGALTGALVAIPVGGAIQVVFREVWERTRPAAPPGPEPGDGAVVPAGGHPRGRGPGQGQGQRERDECPNERKLQHTT